MGGRVAGYRCRNRYVAVEAEHYKCETEFEHQLLFLFLINSLFISMKQKLFLVAAAVLALSSCSNDETVEINSGKAIGFRTSVNSRAQEITNANLFGKLLLRGLQRQQD